MFQRLLARIAAALDRARIPYMVIGGQAVLLYGEARLTKDIDVTLGVGLDRLDDVVGVSRSLGLTELVDPATFTRETMVLPCHDPDTTIRVDFVLSDSGYEREALARARVVPTGGADVRFAAPEDLVVHKMIAGRPRDLDDVRAVLAKNPGLDRDLVARTLEDLGRAIAEDLVGRFTALVRDIG